MRHTTCIHALATLEGRHGLIAWEVVDVPHSIIVPNERCSLLTLELIPRPSEFESIEPDHLPARNVYGNLRYFTIVPIVICRRRSDAMMTPCFSSSALWPNQMNKNRRLMQSVMHNTSIGCTKSRWKYHFVPTLWLHSTHLSLIPSTPLFLLFTLVSAPSSCCSLYGVHRAL